MLIYLIHHCYEFLRFLLTELEGEEITEEETEEEEGATIVAIFMEL